MSTNAQLQSAFVTMLPRELRDAIYLELWRPCGLRQHIICHVDLFGEIKSHICRWPCATDFDVEDKLQEDVEKIRRDLGVPLGKDITDHTVWSRRLRSLWSNHWACSEAAQTEYGNKVTEWAQFHCFKKGRESSPYIPMLLTCKLISAECTSSIYRSTTFVFSEMSGVRAVFGNCVMPTSQHKRAVPPPGFFQHATHMELSLGPIFPFEIHCCNPELTKQDDLHSPYDFHWLRLDRFRNLRSIKIWMSTRSKSASRADPTCVGITQFSIDALKKILSAFDKVETVVLSAPLAHEIEPEDGYVELGGANNAGLRVWKRGTGDRFHPALWSMGAGDQAEGLIKTSETRDVRLGRLEAGIHYTFPVHGEDLADSAIVRWAWSE